MNQKVVTVDNLELFLTNVRNEIKSTYVSGTVASDDDINALFETGSDSGDDGNNPL